MTYWIAVLTHTHKHTYINIHERSLISCLTLFDHFCVSLLEWCKICHCLNNVILLTDAAWLTLVSDNMPPFLHRVSSLDIFGGLLLSSKKHMRDCSEHICCSCSSLICTVLGCYNALQLLWAREKIKKNKISLLPDLIQHSPWSPPYCLGVGDAMRSHITFNIFKQSQVSWLGCPMKCLVVCWFE